MGSVRRPMSNGLDGQEVDGGAPEREFLDEVAMARDSELLRRCGSPGSTDGSEVPSAMARDGSGAGIGVGSMWRSQVLDTSWYQRTRSASTKWIGRGDPKCATVH